MIFYDSFYKSITQENNVKSSTLQIRKLRSRGYSGLSHQLLYCLYLCQIYIVYSSSNKQERNNIVNTLKCVIFLQKNVHFSLHCQRRSNYLNDVQQYKSFVYVFLLLALFLVIILYCSLKRGILYQNLIRINNLGILKFKHLFFGIYFIIESKQENQTD